MFGAKLRNREVIKMYKGQPHIETTVTFLTPIDRDSELFKSLSMKPSAISKTMAGLNNDVQEVIGDTFTADVQEVHCTVVDLYATDKNE